MSTMRTPRIPDLHPPHPREGLHRFINGLNVDYNLGVPILDPGLSPSKRKEQETAATKLYVRLEVHFYQGGLDALGQLKREFDSEVRQSCSRWDNKPKSDHDTLPVSVDSPLATNQAERECLLSIFHGILDRSQPKRPFSRTRSGPAAFSMDKLSPVQPKRAAEANTSKSPTKRSRLARQAAGAVQPLPDPNSAALPRPDYLFAASELAPGPHGQHSTSTTSKASSQSVFSKVEHKPSIHESIQETVEASSAEQTRCFGSSQDQFRPTSTMIDALNESFHDYDASENCYSKVTRLKDEAYPPTQTTNYSCPPSSALVDALCSSPGNQPQAQGELLATETPLTHKPGSSLAQVQWRKFNFALYQGNASPFSLLSCPSNITRLARDRAVLYNLGSTPARDLHGC